MAYNETELTGRKLRKMNVEMDVALTRKAEEQLEKMKKWFAVENIPRKR